MKKAGILIDQSCLTASTCDRNTILSGSCSPTIPHSCLSAPATHHTLFPEQRIEDLDIGGSQNFAASPCFLQMHFAYTKDPKIMYNSPMGVIMGITVVKQIAIRDCIQLAPPSECLLWRNLTSRKWQKKRNQFLGHYEGRTRDLGVSHIVLCY